MASLRRSSVEKRVDRYGNRRLFHTEKTPKFFRFAGELFGLDDKKIKNKFNVLQLTRPVGLGFGEKDLFGPDNSWETQDSLMYTPYPEYYKIQ